MTKILIEIDTDTQRVVPVDPDNEMITAGIVAHAAHDFLRVDHIYRDMIAAAPQPEPVDANLRKDAERLNFIESHPNWLAKHKKRWHCVMPSTNYEYPVFDTAREAIDAAIAAAPKEK